MAGIEIKKLRNWDGPIEALIKELEVFKRRYPGQRVKLVEGNHNSIEVWIYKEEKDHGPKPDTSKGLYRSEQLKKQSNLPPPDLAM